MNRRLPAVRTAAPALAVALLLGACGGGEKKGSGEQEQRAVAVAVEEAAPRRIEDWLELPGKIEAYKDVTVSAEVGGVLDSLLVDEGVAVARGEKMAVIDREGDWRIKLDNQYAIGGSAVAVEERRQGHLPAARLAGRRRLGAARRRGASTG